MFQSRAMTVEEAAARVPALAAAGEHYSRSERYGFIPTTDVLTGLTKNGFEIFQVQQANVRKADRYGFQKHLIRLRRTGTENITGEVPEIVLINSHDGSSAYKIFSGLFRFICANGLVCGDKWGEERVQHSGDVVNKVIEGTYRVVENFAKVTGAVEVMRSIELSRDEQLLFANTALPFRFDLEEGETAPVPAERFLMPRRVEDSGKNDLWTTFNRVQENMIKGGLHGRIIGTNGRRRRTTTREVAGIDQNLKINQALFTLAEGMAKLKGQTI